MRDFLKSLGLMQPFVALTMLLSSVIVLSTMLDAPAQKYFHIKYENHLKLTCALYRSTIAFTNPFDSCNYDMDLMAYQIILEKAVQAWQDGHRPWNDALWWQELVAAEVGAVLVIIFMALRMTYEEWTQNKSPQRQAAEETILH